MTAVLMGDMARNWLLRSSNAQIKTQMNSLQQELVNGRVSDPARRMGGDLAAIAALERTSAVVAGHKANAAFAATLLDSQQEALENAVNLAQDRMLDFVRPELFSTDDKLPAFIRSADQALDDVIRYMNTTAAGRSVFAGAFTDQPALLSRDQMLDAIVATLPPNADAVAIDQAVSDWFAPTGDFEVSGYLGGDPIAGAFPTGDGQDIRLTLTAKDPAIRDMLASFAKAAILHRTDVDVPPDQQRFLLQRAGQSLNEGLMALRDLQAQVGVNQARSEAAKVQAESAQAATALSLERFLSVDQFETANVLQQAMSDLEKIHVLTARLSRLSLSDYL